MHSEDGGQSARVAALRAQVATILKDKMVPKAVRKNLKRLLKQNPLEGLPLPVQEERLQQIVAAFVQGREDLERFKSAVDGIPPP